MKKIRGNHEVMMAAQGKPWEITKHNRKRDKIKQNKISDAVCLSVTENL